MLELLECEVLQKVRYINTLTFTFTYVARYPKSDLSQRAGSQFHQPPIHERPCSFCRLLIYEY